VPPPLWPAWTFDRRNGVDWASGLRMLASDFFIGLTIRPRLERGTSRIRGPQLARRHR
jgi:hypothetical protein